MPWTRELRALKRLAEKKTGAMFNSCLANLYHNGLEGVAWHSDDEKTLAGGAVIASLSFGAERDFGFRHKRTKETHMLVLEHGSLLTMEGSTQKNWVHRLPPRKRVKEARINLTFRSMLG
jgi:alkylated DNA repair dioxygenase AlkB